MKMTRRSTLLAAIAVSLATLVGCAQPQAVSPATSSVSDVKEIIAELESLPVADRTTELSASIRPEVAVVTSEAGEREYAMPADEFYVAIAPYVEQTHDCTFHSPTGCLGELRNTTFEVDVTDPGSGEVVLQEAISTNDNGFLGLWLPRDRELEVVVRADGRTTTGLVRTSSDSPTCLTTFKLS